MKRLHCFATLWLLFATGAAAQNIETTIGTLRGTMLGANQTAIVLGWNNAADGGGGTFYSDPSAGLCGFGGTGTTTNGSNVVTAISSGFNYSGLALNMAITGPGILTVPPTTVTGWNQAASTITMSQAAGSGATTGPIALSGDNGGTQIVDLSNYCFHRATTNYGPKEWGAQGNRMNDDTFFLQNWLNATQPHVGDVGQYLVTSPLYCNSTVQGPTNRAGNKLFQIVASGSFSGMYAGDFTQSVLGANSSCRLSGVDVEDNQLPNPQTGTTTIGSMTITAVSSVSGVNLFNAVTDQYNYIPPNSVVTSISSGSCPCSVTFTNPGGAGASNSVTGENITFWGPNAVDVLGGQVTIDGFSSLKGGQYGIDCGTFQVAGLEVKDTEIFGSGSDNVFLSPNCANVRLIGDTITSAGGRGVAVLKDNDITIADGIIEESAGIGLDIEDDTQVSVTGMTFTANGMSSGVGGAALQIGDNAGGQSTATVSVCGNHFHGSGVPLAPPHTTRL